MVYPHNGIHIVESTVKKNKLPILLVHGTDDDFVPCEMTRQGYAVCSGPKELMLIVGADHGTSFLVDTPRYKQTVFAFLNRTVGEEHELL